MTFALAVLLAVSSLPVSPNSKPPQILATRITVPLDKLAWTSATWSNKADPVIRNAAADRKRAPPGARLSPGG